jgi:hypothetical protein
MISNTLHEGMVILFNRIWRFLTCYNPTKYEEQEDIYEYLDHGIWNT